MLPRVIHKVMAFPLPQAIPHIVALQWSQSHHRPDNLPLHPILLHRQCLTHRMAIMLQKAGIQYKLAQNGKEGVKIFEKHLPALVLLDINMPIMNGFDACKAMRAVQSPFIHRIVAITALGSEVEKRKGRECGMNEWRTKPTRMAPLLRNIKRE
jgi:DNA-binding response OmpR family regulator